MYSQSLDGTWELCQFDIELATKGCRIEKMLLLKIALRLFFEFFQIEAIQIFVDELFNYGNGHCRWCSVNLQSKLDRL